MKRRSFLRTAGAASLLSGMGLAGESAPAAIQLPPEHRKAVDRRRRIVGWIAMAIFVLSFCYAPFQIW